MKNCVSRQKKAARPGGGPPAHSAGRIPLHLQVRFRDIQCPPLYSLVVERLLLRRLSRRGPHGPHKRLPGWALPMAGGVLFAILMVSGLTSAFLVVQHPRCEPMGYPTGSQMTFTRAGVLHPA
jgi:hypothetical protein